MALWGTSSHLRLSPLPRMLEAVILLGMAEPLGALWLVHVVGVVHGIRVGHAVPGGWVAVVEGQLRWVTVGQARPGWGRWGRVLHIPVTEAHL